MLTCLDYNYTLFLPSSSKSRNLHFLDLSCCLRQGFLKSSLSICSSDVYQELEENLQDLLSPFCVSFLSQFSPHFQLLYKPWILWVIKLGRCKFLLQHQHLWAIWTKSSHTLKMNKCESHSTNLPICIGWLSTTFWGFFGHSKVLNNFHIFSEFIQTILSLILPK